MSTTTTDSATTDPQGHLDPNKPLALDGITVVDFTRVLAGPTCTRMLADAGARVIKIERPGTGDDTRLMGPYAADGVSEYYRFANLGKESIALNLKDPGDLALVKSMIARADVVVENFRPGVMARLGLDPANLVKQHPRLIVCSVSEFGQYGPMHQQAAYDTVIQAIAGIMDGTGTEDGGPTRVGTSISDILAGSRSSQRRGRRGARPGRSPRTRPVLPRGWCSRASRRPSGPSPLVPFRPERPGARSQVVPVCQPGDGVPREAHRPDNQYARAVGDLLGVLVVVARPVQPVCRWLDVPRTDEVFGFPEHRTLGAGLRLDAEADLRLFRYHADRESAHGDVRTPPGVMEISTGMDGEQLPVEEDRLLFGH